MFPRFELHQKVRDRMFGQPMTIHGYYKCRDKPYVAVDERGVKRDYAADELAADDSEPPFAFAVNDRVLIHGVKPGVVKNRSVLYPAYEAALHLYRIATTDFEGNPVERHYYPESLVRDPSPERPAPAPASDAAVINVPANHPYPVRIRFPKGTPITIS